MLKKLLWMACLSLILTAVSIAQTPDASQELVVVLMGDPQLYQQKETATFVRTAMDDIRSIDHDAVAVLGDLVQNNATLYADYKKLILDQSTRPVYSLAGNGDVNAGLDAYKKATGHPLYYTVYIKGIRFIFLSVVSMSDHSDHICHLGTEQLAWLTKELDTDTTSSTIIFAHTPLFETTYGSGQTVPAGHPGPMYLYESAQIKQLFQKHPNVIMFASGHVHYQYGKSDNRGQDGWHQQDQILYIAVGATANNQGSSVLYITDDKIKVKVRDHQSKKWIDRYQFDYPVKTTFTKPSLSR